MESPLPHSARSPKPTRDSRWAIIRATRAFYGRPLQLEDLEKINTAQQAAGRPRPARRITSHRPGYPTHDHPASYACATPPPDRASSAFRTLVPERS